LWGVLCGRSLHKTPHLPHFIERLQIDNVGTTAGIEGDTVLDEKSKVALVTCSSYDEAAVFAAVQRGIELIGGMESYIKSGESIVLKPNILVGETPEKIIGPHPAVFKAVAQLAQAVTPSVSYGDSPAFGKPANHAQKAGLAGTAETLNIPLADFENGREVHFPDSPFIKQFTLANGVLDANGLISIAKFKTHQLTRLTGPIKNQFGCVPGALKAEFHLKLPNPIDFAKMLVCLNLYIRPRLYIVDGIIAMEGNGPRGGDPIKMNVLLFSKDPVAIEVMMCHLINLDPAFVPTIKFGAEYGLGSSQVEEVEWVGDPFEPLIQKRFNVVREPVHPVTSSGMTPFLRNLISPRPVIDTVRCNHCGTCVRSCPVTPKAVDWHDGGRLGSPTYKYERCIRCFCCQELCPERAVSIQTPLLGRILRRS
jgi:uncharacterized protein (DUF362 family)/Pyruvate/2-oxoacid:ferredoxin oxidoreductase delta subunit